MATVAKFTTVTVWPDGHAGRTSHPDGLELVWLQDQVGGWIEAVSGPGWVAFVNEEGKLHQLPRNPMAEFWMRENGWQGGSDFIVGPAVFVGPTDREGESTSLPDHLVTDLLAYVSTESAET